MKRIVNILILIIIYLITGARSCTNDADNQQMKEERLLFATVDSLKKTFDVETPDDLHLRALEATARQKLIDFSEYLKIATDSTLDKTFREQAEEMARKLIIPGKAETSNRGQSKAGIYVNTMQQSLNEKSLKGITCSVLSGQIKIKTPLSHVNDSTYIGALSFNQQFKSSDNSKQKEIFTKEMTIDIFAIKIVKSFGNKQLSIWEVYLGGFIYLPLSDGL